MAVDGVGGPGSAPPPTTPTANRPNQQTTSKSVAAASGPRASAAAGQTAPTPAADGDAGSLPGLAAGGDGLIDGVAPPCGTYVDIFV